MRMASTGECIPRYRVNGHIVYKLELISSKLPLTALLRYYSETLDFQRQVRVRVRVVDFCGNNSLDIIDLI